MPQGERANLIVWSHSSNWRWVGGNNRHPYRTESLPPDPRCLSYTHDRDYGVFATYPEGTERHRGKGWCPPVGKEYPGFRMEHMHTPRAEVEGVEVFDEL